jgi:hypothetical protein
MVGQCGHRPCGDGGQRLEKKGRGQRRLEESCEGSQSPPRAVVLMMMMMTHLHLDTGTQLKERETELCTFQL